MTPTVLPFDYDGSAVRVIDRNGAPWFVLADICAVLAVGNPSDAARRLDPDEVDTLDSIEGIGIHPNASLVSESGLYALILTSRKPEARRFKKWVTADLLPSLRRNGSYTMPGATMAAGAARNELARRALARRELPKILERLEDVAGPATRRIQLALARADCEALGIEPPTEADYPVRQGELFNERAGDAA